MDRLAIIKTYLTDELSVDPDELEDEDQQLIEEDIIDSLGIFSLVEYLEERFSIEIEPEEITIANFSTLRNIDALLATKVGDGS